jgi:predicted lipoprotein
LSEQFDARAFTEKLWTESLPESLDHAVAAPVLFDAIRRDPRGARKKHGRQVGIGNVYYYFLAGTGRVVSVEEDTVGLSLGDGTDADILIETSMIFGNSVRNGTGLVNVNDFPNSEDFNRISQELNRIVEERVLPPFHADARIGASVRFAGCARVLREETDLHPMRIVPVALEIQ